jgi:hypothetical protein
MAPRTAWRNLSDIANIRSAILAPAIAPREDGCNDLKNRWSPPAKWRYGVITTISELEEFDPFTVRSMLTDVDGWSWVDDGSDHRD